MAHLIPDSVVRRIRERYAIGAAQVDLANEFGVSQAWVSCVVTGRKRRGAGGPIKAQRTYHRRSPA